MSRESWRSPTRGGRHDLVGRAGRWWQLAVATAAAGVLIALTAVVVVGGVYDGREERSAARAPREASFFAGEPILFDYRHVFTTFDGLPLSVTYVEPRSSEITPPPGLTRWPAPGTYVASPSLAEDRARLDELYGTYAGPINPDTLGSPREPLVYVRPAGEVPRSGEWPSATGFGYANPAQYAGEIWYVQPAYVLTLLLVVFVLAPTAVLLTIVLVVAARRTLRRAALLEALGMGPMALTRERWREFVPATVLAAVVVAGIITAAGLTDVPLPGVGYTLNHNDVQRIWPLAFLVLALGLGALNVTGVLAMYPARLRTGTRPRARNRSFSGRAAAILALVAGALGLVVIQSAMVGDPSSVMWFFAGTLITLLSMVWVTGWLVQTAARVLTAVGNRQTAPSALLAGRQLAATSRQAGRLSFITAAIVFLVCQVAVVNHLGNADAQTARQTFARLDGRVATIAVPSTATQQDLDAVLDALPQDLAVAEMVFDAVENFNTGEIALTSTIITDPDRSPVPGMPPPGDVALAELPDPLPLLVGQAADAGTVTVEEHPLEPRTAQLGTNLATIATDSAGLDAERLQATLNTVTAPGWTASVPGHAWRDGAAIAQHQSRWIVWSGAIAAATLLGAAWVSTHEVTRATMFRLAPLAAFTGRRETIWRVVALRTAMVVFIGFGAAAAMALHYGSILPALGLPAQTPRLLAVLAVPTAATAAFSTWATARSTLSAMVYWRPGRNDE